MADWFKFFNDGLDEPRFQFAISEQPLVTSVWLVILSEASKKRSSKITWRDEDFELLGFARKINVSPGVLNQCVTLLEKIGYISRDGVNISITDWDSLQSNYAKGLDRGYYKSTNKSLVSDEQVSTTRGEERRVEERRKEVQNHVVLMELPDSLKTQRMMRQWGVWMNFRRGMKKPKNWATLFNAQIEFLSGFAEPVAFEILSSSIRNGWQGLFEPRGLPKKPESQQLQEKINVKSI